MCLPITRRLGLGSCVMWTWSVVGRVEPPVSCVVCGGEGVGSHHSPFNSLVRLWCEFSPYEGVVQ